MPQEIDEELKTGLRRAKTKPMLFCFVFKGGREGKLLVSQRKPNARAIQEIKREIGGGKIFQGFCETQDRELVFVFKGRPPNGIEKTLRQIIKRTTGLSLIVGSAVEGEEDEREGED